MRSACRVVGLGLCALVLASCAAPGGGALETYGRQVAFLRAYGTIHELNSPDGQGLVAVSPTWQGRVMTSSLDGLNGTGFGYINADFIASRTTSKQFNNYGGEDRFWLAPEAGQFGLYFKPGDPFDIDRWLVPPAFNEGEWSALQSGPDTIAMTQRMSVTNHSGTRFDLDVSRKVRVLSRDEVQMRLGLTLAPKTRVVAFESHNRITNTGATPWTKQGGLPAIWSLGQFNPTPHTVVIVPFRPGPDKALGPKVKTAYFGTIPPDRLKVHDHYLVFRTDGTYRSKIGVPFRRARPILGSYDFRNDVLTLVQYSLGISPDRVNSMWCIQKDPYAGAVVTSYNDGPVKPGAEAMGGFYEMETVSAAAALRPGEKAEHTHRTIHLAGERQALAVIVNKVLGVRLSDVRQAMP